jgi:hypothetical protein
VFLLAAAGNGRLIYGIATATEAPSQALAVTKYFALADGVIATGYAGTRWLMTVPPRKPKMRASSKGPVDKARRGDADVVAAFLLPERGDLM